MKTLLKNLSIGLSLITGSQAMDQQEIQSYREQIPVEVWGKIFITAFNHKDKILELGNDVYFDAVFGNLRQVCKHWQSIFDQGTKFNEDRNQFWINELVSAYDTIGHGDICRRFLNGVLKYTPDVGEGLQIIDLRIIDLKKPFAGEINLSKCGNAGTHLSISTGYRKGKKQENENKLEIWFAPWFVINRDIQGPASHFNPIFNTWNGTVAPIGIFWTGGWWNCLDDYCYLTNKDIDFISSNNLIKLHGAAACWQLVFCGEGIEVVTQKISCSF